MMPDQTPELTTRQQLELDLETARIALAQAERDVQETLKKAEGANKELTEAKEDLNTTLKNVFDISKLSFETTKHLTTLSAGSIVLLVTFLEKLFNTNREWIALIGIALVSFVLSIICAMFSMTQWPDTMLFYLASDKTERRSQAYKQRRTDRAAFLAFLLGIICLVIFALKNLY
jgi:hypothetical protein